MDPPSVPEHVVRFWRALDQLYGSVEPTWWGAVVTDRRFPAVWDANYARIDVATDDLTLHDVESSLLPALGEAGTSVQHVVSFRPDATDRLLQELVERGHRLTWDLVMDLEGGPPGEHVQRVEELRAGDELWERVETSLRLFGLDDDETVSQLASLERRVLAPGGKRWFGARDDDGTIVSLGAMLVLDDVAYIDNVVTFEHARGQGLASAVTARMAGVARTTGVAHVCLLADPYEDAVVGMYERLGFRGVGTIAATRGSARAPDAEPSSRASDAEARLVRRAARGTGPR